MRIIIFTILTFFVGCDNITTIDKLENNISVIFILNNSKIKQVGLITFINYFNENNTNYSFIKNVKFIDNAEVFVNGIKMRNIPTDSLQDNYECYSSSPFLNECFNYYSNQVRLNDSVNTLYINVDGYEIKGLSYTPSRFSIKLIDQNLIWSKSNNAFFYKVTIHSSDDKDNEIFTRILTGTSLKLNSLDFNPGFYNITVDALDKNLYDFLVNSNYKAGFSNAYGVFGSIRSVDSVIYIK